MSWYRELGLYFHITPSWQYERYQQYPEGKGDCISNTMGKIIWDEDGESTWAYIAMRTSLRLLRDGKRWPDEMNDIYDAKNRIEWWWSKLIYKLNITEFEKYRPQTSLTRDPFIYALTAMFFYYGWVPKLYPPFYLFSPLTWVWIYYLRTGKGLWLFKILDNKRPHKKGYVNKLRELRRLAVNTKKQ